MKVKKLLEGIPYELIRGNVDVEIQDICYDSRKIKNGDAFVALVGIDINGHQYISDVIKMGCKVIIACQDVEISEDVTVIKIDDTRTQLAYLSANLFKNPGNQLIKIAFTGTKGKTSSSWMLKKILEMAGKKVGVIGTLGTFIDCVLYEHKNTTPESYQVQKFMRQMVDAGIQYLIMETSSQALKVGRIANVFFDYGIFTNLSMDHVGPREHSSFEDYIASKALLFQQCKIGIFNQDDEYVQEMVQKATCLLYFFGQEGKDLKIEKFHSIHTKNFLGMEFSTTGHVQNTFRVAAPGEFSVWNATGVVMVAQLLGIDISFIQSGLETFQVDGRCEIFHVHDKFKIVVDFAHNKISMESILKTMKDYHPNRIITIFGCGGGRSSDRRYELGAVAGAFSDLSIVTTDNPRNDDIEEINADIIRGIQDQNGEYLVILDREEAILYALEHGMENDIILLLGKGHETYQEIKGEILEFHEKDIIQNFLNR